MDSLEELAATADLTAAQQSGALDDVEDELFRFGRIVASSTELRAALTDRTATVAAKSRAAAQPARRPGRTRSPSGWSCVW